MTSLIPPATATTFPSFEQKEAVVKRFLDAHYKNPKDFEAFKATLSTNMVFRNVNSQVQTNPPKPAVETYDKVTYLQKMQIGHFGNTGGVTDRKEPCSEIEGDESVIVCRIENLQERKGLGSGENFRPGTYHIQCTCIFTFVKEGDEWKIDTINQNMHSKTLVPPLPK